MYEVDVAYFAYAMGSTVVLGTQENGKEGLRDRLGWKCIMRPVPGALPIGLINYILMCTNWKVSRF